MTGSAVPPGEEAEARQAMRVAWRSRASSFPPRPPAWLTMVGAFVALDVTRPLGFAALGVGIGWAALRARGWRRADLEAPLVGVTVASAGYGEVVVRLDDGALWGFRVSPEAFAAVRIGESLAMPVPREGPVVAARRNLGGSYTGIVGVDCALVRPAAAAYRAPIAALSDAAETRLTTAQAQAFLAHRIGLLSAPQRLRPRFRSVLADLGTEPSVEEVVVTDVAADRVTVRGLGGQRYGWTVRAWPVRPVAGQPAWATRLAPGLHVALVVDVAAAPTRPVQVIWPSGPAVQE